MSLTAGNDYLLRWCHDPRIRNVNNKTSQLGNYQLSEESTASRPGGDDISKTLDNIDKPLRCHLMRNYTSRDMSTTLPKGVACYGLSIGAIARLTRYRRGDAQNIIQTFHRK